MQKQLRVLPILLILSIPFTPVLPPLAAVADDSDSYAAVLVLGGLIAADDDLNEWVRNNNNSTTASNVAEAISLVASPVGLYLGTWYAEKNTDSKEAREFYHLARKAIGSAGTATIVLKFATGRSRPIDEKKGEEHFGPSFEYDSFPSGHAAAAFALAKFLATKEPKKKKLYYGAATVVGLARIYQEKHHTSDVFAGALLGHYVASYTLKHKRAPLEWRIHF
jgi:membrane-associated phospholipid phosphatase